MKIYSLKPNMLNEADRLELATLLIKAGYTVRIGREKSSQGKPTANVIFVEATGGEEYERGQSKIQF